MLALLWTRSDEYVVRRVLSGRRNDFGVLVRRYLPAVMAVVRGILKNPADTDDVSQECFIAAYQKLDTLKSQEKFGAWLLTIARHTALNWQRSRSREVPLEEGMAETLHREEPAPDRKEMQQMLHATLMDLDPEVRELLLMHYYGGCSLREIAQIKGSNRLAVGKRLQRAREALGAEFLKLVPDAPASATLKKRAKTITTAVLAAGAAWKTVPAYGMVATLVLGAVKLAGVGVGVLALSVCALFAAPTIMGWKPNLPVPKVMAAATAAPAKAVMPAQDEPTTAMVSEGEAEEAKEEPLLPYSSLLVTPLGQPIGNAEVVAERITWKERELPPPETERWSAIADANGTFTFPGLPRGKYCVTAHTRVFGGASDINVRDGRVDKFRDIKMYPMITSYGLLVDAQGKPVAGAAIYPVSHELFANQEFDHVRIASVRATSDEQGRFAFTGIIPGRWKLYVVAPNHEPYYSALFPCFGLQSKLVIEDPGTLMGRVVDENGKPRANVKGTARVGEASGYSEQEGYSYRMGYKFVSNEEGNFQIDKIAPASYSFAVEDAVLTLSRPKTTAEVKSGGTAQVELAVQPGGTIYGRVLNAKTREGIPDMGLSLYPRSSGVNISRRIKTGASGDYYFTGLPAANYEINCVPVSAFPMRDQQSLMVGVALGETVADKDILVEPAMTVAGRVVDVNGKPAASSVFASGMGQYGEAASDAEGTFTLALGNNGRAMVTAVTSTMRSEPVEIDPAAPPKDLVLHLTIPSGGRVEGVVLDGHKKPLYNVTISITAEDQQRPTILTDDRTRTTDGLGKFVLTGLPAGHYTLGGMREREFIGSTTVDVGENATVRDVVIQEAAAGNLTIEGTVHYPNGLPCPFAVLGLGTRQAATAGALGRFTFKELAEGQYTIYVMSPGYSPTAVNGVAAGTKNLNIALSNYVTLAGTVVDTRLKAPVKDFTVSYHALMQVPVDMTGIEAGERAFSDPLGKFRVEKVPAFPIRVEVRAAGYAAWSADIPDPAGVRETVLAVEMQVGAGMAGTVRNEAGEPVASARIYTSDGMKATTDAAGTFALEGLAAGQEVQLSVSHMDYMHQTVTVVPGTGVPVDIILTQTTTVEDREVQDVVIEPFPGDVGAELP